MAIQKPANFAIAANLAVAAQYNFINNGWYFISSLYWFCFANYSE